MKNLIKIKSKLLYLLILFVSFYSCLKDKEKLNSFFLKEYPSDLKGNISSVFYIKNDTLFIYNDNYLFKENEFKYYLLNSKERDSLHEILDIISDNEVESFYGDLDYQFSFNWILSYENVKTEIMDDVNPLLFKKLYNFIKEKSNSSVLVEIPLKNKSFFGEISVFNIIDRTNNIDYRFSSKIDKQLYLHKLWVNLLNIPKEDYFDIDEMDFDEISYEVKFVYPTNFNNKLIDKIYLSKENLLAIKFKDSVRFKGYRLKGITLE